MEIYRNQKTDNYELDITVEEWKEILCLPQVRGNAHLMDALAKEYAAPEQTFSCKALARQYGQTHQFFSVQNVRLGKIVTRYLHRFQLIGQHRRFVYWAVAWLELELRQGEYILRLRPELTAAIRALQLFDKAC